ncbi:cytochrome c3 family protein [Nitratidesulfovibrio vulgaris]|nr:cytochrome c3 family protein [Nitratidesulfovibrio vulgaris]ADP87473.1 Cytochrome c, class III, conserved region [Nitratidesulfovibrio vulgaris RCH1]
MRSAIRWGLLTLVLLSPALAAAYDVPKEIEIKRPAKNKPVASWVGPVKFPHGFHAIHNPCKACHHEESDKSLGSFLPCSQCHNKPGDAEQMSFYRAWHNDKAYSCMGCHRQKRLLKQGEPPISCTRGCHPLPTGGAQ